MTEVCSPTIFGERIEIERHETPYPVSAYTFSQETSIRHVRFDDVHIRIELTDRYILFVSLQWILTLYHVSSDEAKSAILVGST